MPLERHNTAASFLKRAQSWLLRNEAENNLILGIAASLARHPDESAEAPYLATVERERSLVGCALRTPPYKLLLTRADSVAVEEIARDLANSSPELPAVLAPDDTAAAFASSWSTHTGATSRRGMHQRIYELDRVSPPECPGRLRQASVEDLDTVVEWATGFIGEAGPSEAGDPAEYARRMIAAGAVYLWEDGEPVSMAAWQGPTPNGVRISLVFTPPERRRRGYASACVATLSQLQLEQGRRFCFLFTDLANPTSNRIYQRIGYRPVCDISDYLFSPSP